MWMMSIITSTSISTMLMTTIVIHHALEPIATMVSTTPWWHSSILLLILLIVITWVPACLLRLRLSVGAATLLIEELTAHVGVGGHASAGVVRSRSIQRTVVIRGRLLPILLVHWILMVMRLSLLLLILLMIPTLILLLIATSTTIATIVVISLSLIGKVHAWIIGLLLKVSAKWLLSLTTILLLLLIVLATRVALVWPLLSRTLKGLLPAVMTSASASVIFVATVIVLITKLVSMRKATVNV